MEQLSVISEEDFTNLLEEIQALRDDLKKVAENSRAKKKWLRTDEAADYLNISKSQIRVLKSARIIPFTKLGGTIYIDIDGVDSILEKNKIDPQQL